MGAILKKLGLTDLQDKFEKEDVTIELLLMMTNDDLKELGIKKLGQEQEPITHSDMDKIFF